MTDMKLPELGENIEGGDVLRIMVKAGDTIKKDQAVIELETDKATIEVPSSVAGVVRDIRVKQGDKVNVGATILTVDENGAGDAPKPAEGAERTAPAPATQAPQQAQAAGNGQTQGALQGASQPDSAPEERPQQKADQKVVSMP